MHAPGLTSGNTYVKHGKNIEYYDYAVLALARVAR